MEPADPIPADAAAQHFAGFPFNPYAQQVQFVQALIGALENEGVALLESPTGTGKTMSIICGVLKWLESERERAAAQTAQQQQEAAQALSAADDPDWLQAAALKHVSQQAPTQQRPLTLQERRERRQAARKRRAVSSTNAVQGLLGKASSPAAASDAGPQLPDASLQDVLLAEDSKGTGSAPATALTLTGLLGTSSDEDVPRLNSRGSRTAAADAPPEKTQIIFCSRTHSQLTQFASELRRTAYPQHISMVALASRKVLCINKDVSQLGNANLLNQTCFDMQQVSAKDARKRRGSSGCEQHDLPRSRCPHLKREGGELEAWQDEVLSTPADVEELARLGSNLGVCPYYGGRSLVPLADVILAPYAVVLSQDNRQAVGLRLEGNVLVIDEAHNLVDALNALHSHTVTGSDLDAAAGMLESYWQRVGACLGPRNAQHVQLLRRVISTLQEAVAAQGVGSGAAAGTQGASSSAGAAAQGQEQTTHTVVTANTFMFTSQLEDINLFDLVAWVNESKLLVKLASYARWLVQAQPTSPTPSGSQTAKPTSAPTRTRGSSALARSERLASLQAVIGFLSALTNADADGRIIVQRAAKPTQQQQGPTQPPQTQVPQQQHKAQQQGRTAFGLVVSRGSDGSTTSSNGQEKQSETADRDREDDPTAERVRDDQGVMRASGGLKYVLLSAATHFGKVLSRCRAVVLASGTLAPIEGIATQLFSTSGLQWAHTTPSHPHAHNTARGPATTQGTYGPARLLATLTRPAVRASVGSLGAQTVIHGSTGAISVPPAATTQSASQGPTGVVSQSVVAPHTTALQPQSVGSHSRTSHTQAASAAAQGAAGLCSRRALLHFGCGHVVPSDHVTVLVAGSGPTGVELDLRFARRSTPQVMDEVGRVVYNTTMVVPAGVVVFAPSFAYLAQLTRHWERSGMMESIRKRKAVFVEPRAAADVESVLKAYAAAVTGAAAGDAASNGGVPGKPGALLLAVVGGKLSEGINFSNDLGRCVVVLGLPYPNPSDPELRERQAYLDRAASAASGSGQENSTPHPGPAGASASAPGKAALTGRQLYENMCMNAVNQCVGRVVRHRGDYAAILLVDARYLGPAGAQAARKAMGPSGAVPSQQERFQEYVRCGAPIAKLPAWMHNSLDTAGTEWPRLHSRLAQFFRTRQQKG